MRRVVNFVSGAIELITNDDLEEPDYLLFPAEIPDIASGQPKEPVVPSTSVEDETLKFTQAPYSEGEEVESENAAKFCPEFFIAKVNIIRNYAAQVDSLPPESLLILEGKSLNALRELAEILVWADRHNRSIWDLFMEHGVMGLFVDCLHSSKQLFSKQNDLESDTVRRFAGIRLQSHILQTISIIVQSVTREESLYCMFSTNYINSIIDFDFELQSEEILGYFMSTLKSLSLKLNKSMLQFFFDPVDLRFPLFSAAVRFFDHPERMTRIAVRNITLSVFAVCDTDATRFALQIPGSYLENVFTYLVRLCGSVARALELILDDGLEIPRNRQRTGLFRKRVRSADVTVRLSEIEHLVLYIADLYAVPSPELRKELRRLISTRLFAPFFRPLASRASLSALSRPSRRWPLRTEDQVGPTQCLAPFDAAARTIVFTFIFSHLGDSPLTLHFLSELARPNRAFEGRSILNAFKAMIGDLVGTERVSYTSLRAVESLISCRLLTPQLLDAVHLVFEPSGSPVGQGGSTPGTSLSNMERIASFPESLADDEPVLMTLTDFEAPLTPCVSLPNTPNVDENTPLSPVQEPVPNDVSAAALKRTTLNQSKDADLESFDEEEILRAFRTGDAPLRDTLSSVLLVVRRKEARTSRLIQTVSRILMSLARKTNSWILGMDVTAAILEVLAASLKDYINAKGTGDAAIHTAYSNYLKAFTSAELSTKESTEIEFTSEALARTATQKPNSAGKRRRALDGDITPPVDYEDAMVVYAMVRTYEEAYGVAYEGLDARLSAQLRSVVDRVSESSSVAEKHEALNDIADIAMKAQSSP